MKDSIGIVAMAKELERRKALKRDLIVDNRQLTVLTGEHGTEVSVRQDGETVATFDPQHLFMRQLGQHLGVRADFADRLRGTYPATFDRVFNDLLQGLHGERENTAQRHMLRTYMPENDGGLGVARALLGDKYRRIDNDDIAETVIPIILDEMPGAEVADCEVTDTRMYIKVLFDTTVNLKDLIEPGHHKFLPEGPDTVQAGFVLTNSEVGAASFSLDHMLYRLVCTNGLITAKSMSRRHVGTRQEGAEDFTIYSTETQKQSDKALMMQIGDAVRHTVNEERFRQLAQQFADAVATEPIEAPMERVKELAPKVGLTEGEGKSVLERLMEGGDKSKFGFINAITAAAQDVESYDRSVEMERIGGEVLAMSDTQWRELAVA